MDNVKNDKYYLEKIISDLGFIIEHTKGKTKDEIENNDLLVDSIMFRIIQIAENNSRLSEEFKKEYSEISWVAIKGMRNKIVHDYGVVNMVIVYDTVTRWIPEMYEKLIRITLPFLSSSSMNSCTFKASPPRSSKSPQTTSLCGSLSS